MNHHPQASRSPSSVIPGTASPEPRSSDAVRQTTGARTPPRTTVGCKSPFVTPTHPLYVFDGNGTAKTHALPPTPRAPTRRYVSVEDPNPAQRPPRPIKRGKTCLESMESMSLDHPQTKTFLPASFSPLCRPRRDDDDDEPRDAAPVDDDLLCLRKSTTFGAERFRELSVRKTHSLADKLVVIRDDNDGLARRLRRMKRRLFLDCVSSAHESSPEPQQASPPRETLPSISPRTPPAVAIEEAVPLAVTTPPALVPPPRRALFSQQATPKTSNLHHPSKKNYPHASNATTTMMEGMEVVLEDHLGTTIVHDETFAEDDDDDASLQLWSSSDEIPAPPQISRTPLPKRLSASDSNLTEATAACSCSLEDDDDDGNNPNSEEAHWVSLSSISEVA